MRCHPDQLLRVRAAGSNIEWGTVSFLKVDERLGNVTGVGLFGSNMDGKQLGLLHELVPTAALIGVLLNPSNPNVEIQLKDVQEAARAIGQQIHIVPRGLRQIGRSTDGPLVEAI